MATSPTALHPLGPRWAPPSVGLSFLCLPDSGPAHPTQVPCPGILNNVEGHQRPPHPLEQDPSSRPRVPGEGPGPGECVGWGADGPATVPSPPRWRRPSRPGASRYPRSRPLCLAPRPAPPAWGSLKPPRPPPLSVRIDAHLRATDSGRGLGGLGKDRASELHGNRRASGELGFSSGDNFTTY